MERTDGELVRAACTGDVDSFRGLYERHYKMAVALAYSRLGDRHLSEDAAQEAFAIACGKLKTLTDGNRFAQWLGTICRRAAGAMASSRPIVAPFHAEDVVETATDADDHSFVRDAIGRLSAAHREVIFLRYFSDLSYEQIAQVIEATPQSVHGRLQRARQSLAKELGETLKR